MKKIYILQMQSYTGVSRMISYLNRYPYSHVAISLQKDCQLLYSFGRLNPKWVFPGGLSIERRNGAFYNRFSRTICRIYELAVNDRQYENLKRYLEKMTENREALSYDYCGIVLRFFHIPVSFKNRYVCTQFCTEALDASGIWDPGKSHKWVRPQDFENIEGASQIYEGIYRQY